MINLKIDDPKPVADMPGFNKVIVHLVLQRRAHGPDLFRLQRRPEDLQGRDLTTLNKNPFQANLDKIKTDQQPSFGGAGGRARDAGGFRRLRMPLLQGRSERSAARTSRRRFRDKVRVYFMDFPLESIHPWSRAAAIAGRCVLKQGAERLLEVSRLDLRKQTEITPETYNAKLMEWAGQAAWIRCSSAAASRARRPTRRSTAPQAMGRALGVDGTPTLYLNGRKLMDQNGAVAHFAATDRAGDRSSGQGQGGGRKMLRGGSENRQA